MRTGIFPITSIYSSILYYTQLVSPNLIDCTESVQHFDFTTFAMVNGLTFVKFFVLSIGMMINKIISTCGSYCKACLGVRNVVSGASDSDEEKSSVKLLTCRLPSLTFLLRSRRRCLGERNTSKS